MKQYLDILRNIKTYGSYREDRTGVGCYSLFGQHFTHNLQDFFPLLTTKKVHFKSIVAELLWFLQGGTNSHDLEIEGVTIWKEWADENGELGPIYGKQWRAWETTDGKFIDQMDWVVKEIIRNPYSRRLIVSAWNVGDLSKMALPPCHLLFQFFVKQDRYLSLQMYQRSCDYFLGAPFNIASYALLLSMVAQVTNLVPELLHIAYGDVHLYKNHRQQASLQLSREPLMQKPFLCLNKKITNLFDFKAKDIKINNYIFHPAIPAPIAV